MLHRYKRIIVSFLILFLGSLCYCNLLQAQDTTQKARIEFAEPMHSYGNLAPDSLARHRFEFRNSGNAMLIVTYAQPSCSCMTLDWTKGPVMPGEKGWVDVSFRAEGPGPFDKGIWVSSNGTDTSGQPQPVELRVRGLVLTPKSRKTKH